MKLHYNCGCVFETESFELAKSCGVSENCPVHGQQETACAHGDYQQGYKDGFKEGEIKQAILEIRGRARFLQELREESKSEDKESSK